jgi:hypothetical protein
MDLLSFCFGMAFGAVLMTVIVCIGLAWNKVSGEEEE